MKFTNLLSCLLFISCHQQEPIVPYATAIGHCNEMLAEQQKTNPAAFSAQPDCLLGAGIPPIHAVTIAGKTIGENYFKGKVTVVNFWFTSCAPCVAAVPGLNEIVKKLGKDRINYLAIGRGDAEEINRFLTDHPWDFDHIAAGGHLIYDVFQLKTGFPATFLLNEKAEIIFAFTGGKTDSTAALEIQNKLIPKIEEALAK